MRSYRSSRSIPESVLARISAKANFNYNSQYACLYRESDETGLTDWTHISWGERLREISASFRRPIDVLDLGCGTGRYFHCLQNVQSLIGVDISKPMLSIARNNPILQSEIKVEKIDLIHGDILRIDFPEQSFDFVYSVGVLGDYAPLSLALLERIWRWLKYGGSTFLTVMDSASPKGKSWKRSLATFLYPVLPHSIKVYVDIRIGDYTINWCDFEALLRQTRFTYFKIYRQVQRRTFLFTTAQKIGD